MKDKLIACSLEAGDLKERLAWIAALNARALKMSHRDGRTVTLDYDPAAIDDVRKMVAGERACCAFLHFEITERPDVVRVSIVAPEEAADAADLLFGPFAYAPNEAKSCGCVRECGA